MSRIYRHIWPDAATANAFVTGVEWANDSALEVIGIEDGDTTIVTIYDNESFGDEQTISHLDE